MGWEDGGARWRVGILEIGGFLLEFWEMLGSDMSICNMGDILYGIIFICIHCLISVCDSG